MIWTGDDIGSQRGMLIAPDTWRRFLKPRMAEFVSRVKAIKPDLLVAYHTDGDVREVIPDLIEIGIDVLNPVQPACMDPAELKRDYGDQLLFWGSIDEQDTLPFGTPAGRRRRDPPAPGHHRPGWRPHPRPDPPRPAGHAAGELLGHGGHHPRDALRLNPRQSTAVQRRRSSAAVRAVDAADVARPPADRRQVAPPAPMATRPVRIGPSGTTARACACLSWSSTTCGPPARSRIRVLAGAQVSAVHPVEPERHVCRSRTPSRPRPPMTSAGRSSPRACAAWAIVLRRSSRPSMPHRRPSASWTRRPPLRG